MKTSFNLLGAFAFTFVTLLFSSCQLNNLEGETNVLSADELSIASLSTTPQVCGTANFTLWAGQTNNAGTLTVSNTSTTLFVTYTTPYSFGTLHLWVGTDMALLPVNSQGVPVPGRFPYQYDTSGGTTYTFEIPLASIPSLVGTDGKVCDKNVFVVAHAEVSMDGSNETAFGGNVDAPGPQIPGSNRWSYFGTYRVACCTEPPPGDMQKLGTGFAKGGYVFTTDSKSNPERLPSLRLTKNRWGWAINVSTMGSTTYDIWVGAGLNNTSKGQKVGTVTVTYAAGEVTVTYNIANGYAIEEAHVYVGDFKPTTIAPGQYGHTAYFNPFAGTYTYTTNVTDTNSDGVWIIAHCVAYGNVTAGW